MQQKIKKAVSLYNEKFLTLKSLNNNFISLFIDPAEQEAEELKHKEKARFLLKEVKKIQNEIERKRGVQNTESYYSLPKNDRKDAESLPPMNELDGYLLDAARAYFVHTLPISGEASFFNHAEERFFDFKLDHMLQDKDLVDSLEVKHTRDWALIGQALALKEIQKKTKKKGRKKKYNDGDEIRDIDIKRADFADGVYSEYYCFYEKEGEEGEEGEDSAIITDLQIITIYREMLSEQNNPHGVDLTELEQHLKLKNITDDAVCNSISNGRKMPKFYL